MSNPRHSEPASATRCGCNDAAEFTCTLCLLCVCCPLSIFCYCVKTPYKIVKHVKCEVCCGSGKKILPEYSSVSDMDIIDSPNKLARRHHSKKKIKKLLMFKN
ncbi:hypothetical protein RDI58_016112 [Solanum bulbocastanum]|uniref:Uncharacterized protein n=1 Tax=Solanum bulbocastanum TaxID=147425 RepID=A0AAN8YCL3_SOLBU